MKKTAFLIGISFLASTLITATTYAQNTVIPLPEPDKTGGKPLMETLSARKSTRVFSTEELPLQTISNVLWAANGITRPDGKRTAPSAHNWQEIDLYVARADGLYFYNPQLHQLERVLSDDRPVVGVQDFTMDAPLNLIFVADYGKMTADKKNQDFYAATDAGFVSQNVYLFCASEGLATVVLGWVDKEALAKAMKIRKNQHIILCQPVGKSL